LGFTLSIFLQQFVKSAPFVYAARRDNPKTDYLAQTAESVGRTFLILVRLELLWFVRKGNSNHARAMGYADTVRLLFLLRGVRQSVFNVRQSPPKRCDFS
jgi:hypothetical protein